MAPFIVNPYSPDKEELLSTFNCQVLFCEIPMSIFEYGWASTSAGHVHLIRRREGLHYVPA